MAEPVLPRVISDLVAATEIAAPHRLWVGHDSWQAVIATDVAPEGIAQFLAPIYRVKTATTESVDVWIITAPDLVTRAETASASHKGALPGDMVWLSGLYRLRPDASQLLTLRHGAARYIYVKGGAFASTFDAARAVRALLAAKAWAAGAVAIHAAAIAVGGWAYLLCGPKRRGKTTNLMAALQHLPGVQFLANDRVYLHQRGTELMALGSPHSIPVRAATFRQFPPLAAYFGAEHVLGGAARGYSEGIDLRKPAPMELDEGETYLSSGELTRAFGVGEVAEAPLAGVIVLAAKGEAVRTPWQRQSSRWIADMLEVNRHTQIETNFAYWDAVYGSMQAAPIPDLSHFSLWSLHSWSRLAEAWTRAAIIEGAAGSGKPGD